MNRCVRWLSAAFALPAPLTGVAHPGHGLLPSALDPGLLHLGLDHVLVPVAVGLWVLFLCVVAGIVVRRRAQGRTSPLPATGSKSR